MTTITLCGPELGFLLKRANCVPTWAVYKRGVWSISYDEPRKIVVISFGHIHFKDVCSQLGIHFSKAINVYQTSQLKGLNSGTTLLIQHDSIVGFNGRFDEVLATWN